MVVEEFISYIGIQKRYSDRTLQLYGEYVRELKEFISPRDENEFISELKPQVIRGFIANGLESGLNPRTINLKLSAISSFCNYLVKRGVVSSNPVKKVPRPKTSKMLPHFYTEGALASYLESKVEEGNFLAMRNRVMVLVLYSTGMRRAELATLRISDWDRGRRMIKVRGKGDKEREVPVTGELSKSLNVYLLEMSSFYLENPEGMFFLTDTGKPLYLSFVNKIVRSELASVPGFTGKRSPHMLRHSIATHLLNNGADLNSIKEVLGHSSLAATQVYTHNSFEQMKKIFLTAHPRAKKGG
ncbi:MAG: tyrosine-type recombinase/integrase [Bacteroidales bacterium]|nr:tyrosine-type recombinase/integrase [Bacteroidales bacterium]